MRNMFLAFGLFLLFSSLVDAQAKSDREMAGLKGTVKTITIETTEISQADLKPIYRPLTVRKTVATFDEKGYKIEENPFSPEGELIQKIIFKCDANRENCEVTSYKPDGTIIRKIIHKNKYDAEGDLIEKVVSGSDGKLSSRLVRTYNSRKQLTEGAAYDEQGLLINRSVYTYDEQGRVSDITVYNRSGSIAEKQVRTDTDYELSLFNNDTTLLSRWNRKPPIAEEIDSHGNWTLKKMPMTVFKGGKSEDVLEVVQRTITYY